MKLSLIAWLVIGIGTTLAQPLEIACPGLPGPLAVFGVHAKPVLLAGDDCVVAQAEYGQGRVVLFGHNGFFEKAQFTIADTAKFLEARLRWAAKDAGAFTVSTVGYPELAELKLNGVTFKEVKLNALPTSGVLVLNPGNLTDDHLTTIDAFIKNGGSLLTGTPGWGWRQTRNNRTLDRDFPFNRWAAAKLGITVADGSITKPKSGRLPVLAPSPLANATKALDAIEQWLKGGDAPSSSDAAVMSAALLQLYGSVPSEPLQPLDARLRKLLAMGEPRMTLPEAKKPLTQKDAAARLLFGLSCRLALMNPEPKAHPAAVRFPGPVPREAPRVSQTVSLPITSKGYICNGVGVSAKADIWHSTGLYAPPGETITVRGNDKLSIRIGAHTDELWHLKSWQRAPSISVRKPIQGETTITNPFGGLIYITAPVGLELGDVSITISGAVAAPLYQHGVTTKAQWQAVRQLPAPWAELASKKVIFTIPTSIARSIDDPAEIMTFWDQVLDACADLTGVSRERGRAERLVHDVQISAGYMHSGYPIMGPIKEAERAIDLARIQREGAWGYFHELGHNHQQSAWTFDGTVEVTCNLYSLYCFEKLCPQAPLHESIRPEAIRKNAKKYIDGGRQFEVWKEEPFTALIMYQQLQQAFGWETFQKVFKAYPKVRGNPQKIDTWLVEMSKATGKNLAPFFAEWGLPVSDAAKKEASRWSDWPLPKLP